MPDPPPPFAGGASLLRRAKPRWTARPHWTAASPRPEDEVCGPKHLARTFYGVHMRGCRLRSGARAWLGKFASEGPGARRTGQPRAFLPIVRATLILVEVERLPRGERRREPRVLWLCGGMVPKGRDRTWACCGAPTSGVSTWSILSASSNRLWDGPPLGCATPSRPTGGGRGWSWSLSPSSG